MTTPQELSNKMDNHVLRSHDEIAVYDLKLANVMINSYADLNLSKNSRSITLYLKVVANQAKFISECSSTVY